MSDDDDVIRSPIPGVFYRRPDPDSPAYVDEGARVEPGQVVGLVEVMKQFHEVHTERSGTLVEFLVEEEGMVAPGDAIARLDAAGD